MTDIRDYLVGDITDTTGASKHLTDRFHRSIGIDSVHKFVREGRLRAWMFQDGQLIPREKDQDMRGKDLIFLKADLDAMKPPRKPGNPNIANLRKKMEN